MESVTTDHEVKVINGDELGKTCKQVMNIPKTNSEQFVIKY